MNRTTKIGLLGLGVLAGSVLLVGCGRPTPPNGMPPQGGQFSGERPTPPNGETPSQNNQQLQQAPEDQQIPQDQQAPQDQQTE